MKSVSIIMPVHNTPDDWQRESIVSLEAQNRRGEDFDIHLIRVTRHDNKVPLVDCSLSHLDIEFDASGFDHPTSVEQAIFGIEYAKDSEFIGFASSNDRMSLNYYSLALRSLDGAMVAYGDIMVCDGAMNPVRVIEMPKKFHPPYLMAINKNKLSNSVPDTAVFRSSILGSIVPDAEHHRGAFHVFWLKIWEKMGPESFVHIGRHGHMMRHHDMRDGVIDRSEYCRQGLEIVNRWVENRPWFMEYRKFVGQKVVIC